MRGRPFSFCALADSTGLKSAPIAQRSCREDWRYSKNLPSPCHVSLSKDDGAAPSTDVRPGNVPA